MAMAPSQNEVTVEKRKAESPEGVYGVRRKRVAVACSSCRLRKSKCDGWRPKCSTCRDFGFECVYLTTASSIEPNEQNSVGKLETRLRSVEKAVNASDMKVLLDQMEMRLAQRMESFVRCQGSESENPIAASSERKNLITLHRTRLQDTEATTEDMSDGMGTLNFADEEDSIFFGPTSSVAFIGHISGVLACIAHERQIAAADHNNIQHQTILEQTLHDQVQQDQATLTASHAASPLAYVRQSQKPSPNTTSKEVNIYVIPPEDVVLNLLDQYFRNTYIVFPFLHPPSFLEEYRAAVNSGFNGIRRTWLARLNMVLALAASASTDSTMSTREKYTNAEEFYDRASGLCQGHLLKFASLESVQLLILMSQYLQGTQKPIQCWHALGIAIRTALQLGLHSNQALKRFTPLERELRKRAWYACVIIDSTLSMTFGRPSAIPFDVSIVGLPLDVEDEVLITCPTDYDTPQQSTTSTTLTFYIKTIQLYDIVSKIVADIYDGNLAGGQGETVHSYELASKIAKFEGLLNFWRASLPNELCIKTGDDIAAIIDEGQTDEPHVLQRQSIILSLRYYNVILLLHRQTLSNCLDVVRDRKQNVTSGYVMVGYEVNSVQKAVEAAVETIKIVHQVGDRMSMLGAWWFTLYYVFNSGLVLVAAILAGHQQPVAIDQQYLDNAINVLDAMASENEIADRCQLFLSYLKHAIHPTEDSMPNHHSRLPINSRHQQTGTRPPGSRDGERTNLGLGIGEFMLESDLSLLEQIFPPEMFVDNNEPKWEV